MTISGMFDAASRHAFRAELTAFHPAAGQPLDWTPNFASWPPSDAELQEAQRRMLQDPQWLACWAAGGWTSWTQPAADLWHYDTADGLFRFTGVPCVAAANETVPTPHPGTARVVLDTTGRMIPAVCDGVSIVIPAALATCRSVVQRFRHEIPRMTHEGAIANPGILVPSQGEKVPFSI